MAVKWKDNKKYTKHDGIQFSLEYDFTDLKTLKKNLNILKNRHVKWGWLKARKHESGFYVAQLAYMQEFGTRRNGGVHIPARGYFRQAIEMTRKSAHKRIQMLFYKALHGQDFTDELNQIGYNAKQDFHKSVMQQNMTPLAQETIRKKRHPFQWDDTGQMLQSFDYEVYKSSLTKQEEQAKSVVKNKG